LFVCLFFFKKKNFENRRLTCDFYREMLKSRNKSFERWPTFCFFVCFFLVCFFLVFFLKKMDQIVLGNQPDDKRTRKGFREWSNCSRRPARWRIKREKGFASGLIVSDDLPDRKNKMRKGFREWSNCSRRPARWRIKREKGFASGQIVPGDLPDEE